MPQHNIPIKVYLGPHKHITTWLPGLTTDDLQIDQYGSIWGEAQVLQLGAHFDLYTQYKLALQSTSAWNMAPTNIGPIGPNILPQTMQVAGRKLPGSSVTGNFGEVLTIMALQSRLLNRSLRVCHLCSNPNVQRVKCPDLLFETEPIRHEYNNEAVGRTDFYNLPLLMPGECKNSEFLAALRQISSYWQSIGITSPTFGFGLISNISYHYPPNMKLTILAPIDKAELDNLLSNNNPEIVIRAHFKDILHGF